MRVGVNGRDGVGERGCGKKKRSRGSRPARVVYSRLGQQTSGNEAILWFVGLTNERGYIINARLYSSIVFNSIGRGFSIGLNK